MTTADTDDRVVPGHSFKFTAALQRAQSCDKPVLIEITTRAGHGGGKPTSKKIAETADLWAFLVKNLGMKLDRSCLPSGTIEYDASYESRQVHRVEASSKGPLGGTSHNSPFPEGPTPPPSSRPGSR